MNKLLTHNRKQRGAAMLIFIILFTIAVTAIVALFTSLISRDIAAQGLQIRALQARLSADAGVEDGAYRYMSGMTINATEQITLDPVTVVSETIVDGTNDIYLLVATGTSATVARPTTLEMQLGTGAAFNFGVQTGNGGFRMANGSSVYGNVFSNGPITKSSGGNATIYGDVISAGPSGLIDDINATGTARARTIRDSDIGGDAYAYEIDGGIVGQDAYCQFLTNGAVTGSGGCLAYQPEEATTSLPIPDSTIETIKQDILDTGTVIASTSPECSGGVLSTSTDLTLGFVKIECDLVVQKSGSATTLTLTGSVWVEGSISFISGPTVQIDPGVGNRTVPVIADNPADRLTSSQIDAGQSTTFIGSGNPKSYVLLISQNESAETGGSDVAINLGQSTEGDLLAYAGHGAIELGNSIALNEVTAYRIILSNNTEVRYESGLVNTLFTSGPGAGFSILGWSDR